MAQTHTLSLLPCSSPGASIVELRQSFPSQIQVISPFVDQLMLGRTMRPQPLICVTDVEASSRWYQRLLGCLGAHGGRLPRCRSERRDIHVTKR
jgi:hypothetical protein